MNLDLGPVAGEITCVRESLGGAEDGIAQLSD